MASKLWVHSQFPDKSRDFVWDKVKPGGALAMTADSGWWDRASGITIARKHYPADVQADRVFRPPLVATANQTVDEILNEFKNVDNKIVIYEALNEVEESPGHPLTGDRLKIYAEWGQYVAEAFHRAGKRYLFGSFSVGQPIDIEGDWLILAETIRTVIKFGGALSVHEYNAPTVLSGDASEWLTLRYRKAVERLRRLGVSPYIIVTELGIDRVYADAPRGWRRAGITAAQYAQQLAAYDTEIQKDAYVLGACIFTCGCNQDWVDFDINNEDAIADYIRTNTTGPAAWPAGASHTPLPAPAPEGNTLIIGAGLRKAESLVGPFLESEQYHFPGTDHEVSLAVGEKGYATWSRTTNEVIAYAYDGTVYRDFGNRRQGELVRVSEL